VAPAGAVRETRTFVREAVVAILHPRLGGGRKTAARSPRDRANSAGPLVSTAPCERRRRPRHEEPMVSGRLTAILRARETGHAEYVVTAPWRD
jgi:hypothetical protein